MEEEYIKKPKVSLNIDYLKTQLSLTLNLSRDWPEASLLSLGRIRELWLLLALGKEHKDYHEDLIRKVEMRSIISKHQGRLLYKIKHNYYYLKHKIVYQLERNFVGSLIKQFPNLM